MHGDEWLQRYRRLLGRKYGLDVEPHDCNVRYRFGGGGKKIAFKRDVLSVGIGGENGEISSHRIRDSPTKPLLSLKTHTALGMVLDLPGGTADSMKLGLYDVKFRRTNEGGWGVRISRTLHQAGLWSRRWSTRRQ